MSMKRNVPTHEVLLKKCPRSSNEVSLSGLSSEYAPPGSMIRIGELIDKLWWPVAGAQIQIPPQVIINETGRKLFNHKNIIVAVQV